MTNKTFYLIGVILFCIFLAGVLVGATIATKAQKELDRVRIEELTEQNMAVLRRVENLGIALDNALGLRRREASDEKADEK